MLFSAVIAEDHDVTRRGVRSILETRMEARVAATTRDGLEVPSLLEEHAPDLMEGIRAVVNGRRYLGEGLSDALLDLTEEAASAESRHEQLTSREREVLQLTGEGLTSKEIADQLYISHRTVEKHREHIREKLDLDHSMEMVRYVLEHTPNPEGNEAVAV
jgi:DNA-binding NarL/FixJ family response regulator